MGMSIDKAIPKIQFVRNALNDDMEIAKAYDLAIDTMRKYQQLQADYNARLNADMVAMLEDLDLQIDESAAYNLEVAKVQRLIRDKIDALRGEKDNGK